MTEDEVNDLETFLHEAHTKLADMVQERVEGITEEVVTRFIEPFCAEYDVVLVGDFYPTFRWPDGTECADFTRHELENLRGIAESENGELGALSVMTEENIRRAKVGDLALEIEALLAREWLRHAEGLADTMPDVYPPGSGD